MKRFLKYKADVNVEEFDRLMTPLHFATIGDYEKSASIVKMLITKGADPNAMDINERTPLHNLIAVGGILSRQFLESECDVNIQDNEGKTALHLACELHAADKVISKLLEYGSDINIRDYEGDTVIDYCKNKILAIQGEGDLIQLLSIRTIIYIHTLFQKHLVKMKSAGFFISKGVLESNNVVKKLCSDHLPDLILRSVQDLSLENECTVEIEKMKKIKISSYSTLFDILFKNQHEMTQYMNNNSFLEVMNSKRFAERFPIYGTLLKSKYRQALSRNELLKPAVESMKLIAGLGLPDLCIDYIFTRLGNVDLRNIIEATKPDCIISRKIEKKKVNGRPISLAKKRFGGQTNNISSLNICIMKLVNVMMYDSW